tara:strand:+ start:67 stop:930 length:864 start_codon:yes stop_codon:yes gene_type:complete
MKSQSHIKKICIGTAQFGSKYGISNFYGKTKRAEAKKIIHLAKLNQINFFDTANNYGESQKIIGSSNSKNKNIISKIKLKSIKDIDNTIKKSLDDLNVKKIYALLIHNPEILLKKNGKKIFKVLIKYKKKKLIKKIGVSEYSEKRLIAIIRKFNIDIISFPYNPFDNRLVTSGIFKELKRKNIEIHIRSIFLQGLLLIKSKNIPKKLKKWSNLLDHFENFSKKNSVSKIKLCLDHAFSLKGIKKITIGVQNHSQLKEILYYLKKTKIKKEKFTYKYIPQLCNPLAWL